MTPQRICIFCGAPPEDKNKEHPLSRWLLEMTGDPNRVVKHGYRWSDGKVFEFSFDSLVFPACEKCNSSYSGFESHAKTVVESIVKKEPVSAADYVHLLDWLDKVRIGLWLGYRYLQGNPSTPSFTIDSRLGKKDRMLAVYTIGDHQVGLNTWGPESKLFQFKPSVFAMRVNSILFLNASWDYMCASRCGYPYPRQVAYSRGHAGMFVTSDFRSRKKITHPIVPGLMKSCVTLFQPVLQADHEGSLAAVDQSDVDYHMQRAWPGRNALGPLIRQFSNESVQLNPDGALLDFDSVSDTEANRTVDIATQAYSLQNRSIETDPRSYEDGGSVSNDGVIKAFVKENTKTLHVLRNLTPEQLKEAWAKAIEARKQKRVKRAIRGQ
ncbi:MAG: hypothetical protein WDO56_15855 [Gammaproteobacteria bacterium]